MIKILEKIRCKYISFFYFLHKKTKKNQHFMIWKLIRQFGMRYEVTETGQT